MRQGLQVRARCITSVSSDLGDLSKLCEARPSNESKRHHKCGFWYRRLKENAVQQGLQVRARGTNSVSFEIGDLRQLCKARPSSESKRHHKFVFWYRKVETALWGKATAAGPLLWGRQVATKQCTMKRVHFVEAKLLVLQGGGVSSRQNARFHKTVASERGPPERPALF